jgi:hypothetical protein
MLFQEGGIALSVVGMAGSTHSKLVTVQWRLDDRPEEEAKDLSGDWLMWDFQTRIESPGTHFITIYATDILGTASDIVELEIRAQVEGAEPQPTPDPQG